ncbi:basic proline-rich protein-like [Gorilla gorilla gorilla]|uniref:basic proline-rich protein-like n=1 Tax=Gorilla gorilla gorilla TaxID=9595 RepID=UPI0030083CB7
MGKLSGTGQYLHEITEEEVEQETCNPIILPVVTVSGAGGGVGSWTAPRSPVPTSLGTAHLVGFQVRALAPGPSPQGAAAGWRRRPGPGGARVRGQGGWVDAPRKRLGEEPPLPGLGCPPRATRARGKPRTSRPGATAPAPGSGWLGGCSRERRGGAGHRWFGGAGKPEDEGRAGRGAEAAGRAGDAGKPLPPVAESQPLTSGVFLKVNNKPRGDGENRSAAAPSGRKEGAGRRRGSPQRGAAREEAADPLPAPGAPRGPEPPPRRRDPAPARAVFSGDEFVADIRFPCRVSASSSPRRRPLSSLPLPPPPPPPPPPAPAPRPGPAGSLPPSPAALRLPSRRPHRAPGGQRLCGVGGGQEGRRREGGPPSRPLSSPRPPPAPSSAAARAAAGPPPPPPPLQAESSLESGKGSSSRESKP